MILLLKHIISLIGCTFVSTILVMLFEDIILNPNSLFHYPNEHYYLILILGVALILHVFICIPILFKNEENVKSHDNKNNDLKEKPSKTTNNANKKSKPKKDIFVPTEKELLKMVYACANEKTKSSFYDGEFDFNIYRDVSTVLDDFSNDDVFIRCTLKHDSHTFESVFKSPDISFGYGMYEVTYYDTESHKKALLTDIFKGDNMAFEFLSKINDLSYKDKYDLDEVLAKLKLSCKIAKGVMLEKPNKTWQNHFFK